MLGIDPNTSEIHFWGRRESNRGGDRGQFVLIRIIIVLAVPFVRKGCRVAIVNAIFTIATLFPETFSPWHVVQWSPLLLNLIRASVPPPRALALAGSRFLQS